MQENNVTRSWLLILGVILVGIVFVLVVDNWEELMVLLDNLLSRRTIKM